MSWQCKIRIEKRFARKEGAVTDDMGRYVPCLYKKDTTLHFFRN